MAAEVGGDLRSGIGVRLKAAREKKGLTILQAAERMHADTRVLESLESEDFASMGGAVYVRGHMRHYADLVGEKPNELLDLYANSTRTVPSQPDLTKISRAQPQNPKGWLAGPAVIVLIGIAVIGTLWWFINSSSENVQPKPASAKVGEIAPAPARDAPPVVVGPEAAQPATPPPAASAKAAAKTVKTTVPPDTSLAVVPPTSPKPPKGNQSERGDAPLKPPSEITLKFSADSWAEVYDASGQRLFYDVGSASSSHTVKGPPPLRVVLGNPSGVAVNFNGKSATIPSNVSPDGSVRFSINARGRAVPTTEGN